MAPSPVITDTLLLFNTLVVFLIKALSKRILLKADLCSLLICVFKVFHASCLYFKDFCALTALFTFTLLASTSWDMMVSVSIPDIRPLILIAIHLLHPFLSSLVNQDASHLPYPRNHIQRLLRGQLLDDFLSVLIHNLDSNTVRILVNTEHCL